MKPFFIVSLPRSRTAWLANFLTYGPSFCFHEGLASCNSMAQFKLKLEATGAEFVGNSDCGNVLFFPRLRREFPDAKFVIIYRSLDEVTESLKKAGLPLPNVEILRGWEALLLRYTTLPDVLTVSYDVLNSTGCRLIWDFCVPGFVFPFERWQMLNDLEVQVFPNRVMQKVSQMTANLVDLLSEEV